MAATPQPDSEVTVASVMLKISYKTSLKCNILYYKNMKGKAIPVTGHGGP
jgi:hypothetical protein